MLTSSDLERLGILNESSGIIVPKDKLAKLMYYLQCVFSILDCPGFEYYTDYTHYRSLTTRQINEVLLMAQRFHPNTMISSNLFLVDSQLISMGFGNQFYNANDRRLPYPINSSVLIGGKSFKVLQVMAVTRGWLNENFYEPMELFASVWCCFCCDKNCRNSGEKSCKCFCWCIYCAIISFIVLIFILIIERIFS